MASRTLLELVQTVLNETGGDEVNSIADTIEASSIAVFFKQCYDEIVDDKNLPSTGSLHALVGLADTTKPNIMRLADDASNMKWLKYDVALSALVPKNYRTIKWLCPEEFVTKVNSNPSTDTTHYKTVQWDSNVPLIIHKFKGPAYWTSFDDKYIVFDSYDSNIDSTLQSSKSIYYSETRPEFTIDDAFVPVLPENLMNLLYIKTVGRYLAGPHDKVNPKIEQQEHRTEIRTSRNKWRQGRQTYPSPDYGRKK